MARAVYSEGKQYKNVHDLEEVIVAAWNNESWAYICTLYKSLPFRLISVIQRKGTITGCWAVNQATIADLQLYVARALAFSVRLFA